MPLPLDVPARSLAALAAGLVRPRRTARALTEGPLAVPAGAVLFVALGWAGLSLALHHAGHAPSVGAPWADRDGYYLLQAVLLPPALLLGWMVLARVAHRAKDRAPWSSTARALGGPYASAILWLFLVPDVAVFATRGFEALAPALRITGPALLLGAWGACAAALAEVAALPWGRAALRAGLGLLAQALLLGAVIR